MYKTGFFNILIQYHIVFRKYINNVAPKNTMNIFGSKNLLTNKLYAISDFQQASALMNIQNTLNHLLWQKNKEKPDEFEEISIINTSSKTETKKPTGKKENEEKNKEENNNEDSDISLDIDLTDENDIDLGSNQGDKEEQSENINNEEDDIVISIRSVFSKDPVKKRKDGEDDDEEDEEDENSDSLYTIEPEDDVVVYTTLENEDEEIIIDEDIYNVKYDDDLIIEEEVIPYAKQITELNTKLINVKENSENKLDEIDSDVENSDDLVLFENEYDENEDEDFIIDDDDMHVDSDYVDDFDSDLIDSSDELLNEEEQEFFNNSDLDENFQIQANINKNNNNNSMSTVNNIDEHIFTDLVTNNTNYTVSSGVFRATQNKINPVIPNVEDERDLVNTTTKLNTTDNINNNDNNKIDDKEIKKEEERVFDLKFPLVVFDPYKYSYRIYFDDERYNHKVCNVSLSYFKFICLDLLSEDLQNFNFLNKIKILDYTLFNNYTDMSQEEIDKYIENTEFYYLLNTKLVKTYTYEAGILLKRKQKEVTEEDIITLKKIVESNARIFLSDAYLHDIIKALDIKELSQIVKKYKQKGYEFLVRSD